MLKPYDPLQPLFFTHIPKTGGSSIREIFGSWFGKKLYLHYRDKVSMPERFSVGAGDCVYGHFNSLRGVGLLEYYPQARQCVVFLREPFARAVSQWRYVMARTPESDRVGLDRWLRERAEAGERDRRSFLCQFPKQLTSENLDSVIRDYYVFVGVLERIQPGMAALARVLGKPAMPIAHLNRTEGDALLHSEFRLFHERHFALEHEVYERCLAISARAIER